MASQDENAPRYRFTPFDGIDPLWWLSSQNNPSEDPHTFGGHHPYARPLQSGWSKDAAGHWQSARTDAHSWEVICEECGDKDGPVEMQPDAVKARRGPYSSKHKAEHAATKHFHETN